MADIPALRPSVIKLIADNSKLRSANAALDEANEALRAEMESLKAMIDAEYDAGGSTGGVVG